MYDSRLGSVATSNGGWADVSLGLASSISNGCGTLVSKIQGSCSYVVEVLQSGWANYISPAINYFITLLSEGFSTSKDFVQTNPVLTGVVALTGLTCATIGYLFGSRKPSTSANV